MADDSKEDQKITLKDQMGHILEEARMVLPGIQALFGFQTVAVFNERFADLPVYVQGCHVAALALDVIAIALVMLPAAYHRLAQPDVVTLHTVKLSSRSICWALAPLAAAIALDLFVVLFVVADEILPGIVAAAASFVLLIGLWFVFPLHRRRRHGYGSTDKGA
ncbi:hypothetical protein IP92_00832 [Pseudoduganella flava]|uniref:Sodium:proton antiporter n=1 Tax=Pseudoduganella flava TaxID=871742 RepID=A0A562Q534_9BURK|nr:DUF6328 family protein [Pseudoduganella flava]QGZ41832.1 hypothetical protein GO485_24085 [Pseudoduganella flava]TWI51842.1 hypothetical protein IP92_00832 [Pseudoduganella flava]